MSRKGFGSIYRLSHKGVKGKVWWVAYSLHGQRYRESTGSEDKGVAMQFLIQRLAERTMRSSAGRVDELLDDLLKHYEMNRKSIVQTRCTVEKNIRPYFGKIRPDQVTTKKLRQYQEARLEAEAAKGSIDREMMILHKAFQDGYDATPPSVGRVPKFPMFNQPNARTGFIEPEQFATIRDLLPEYVRRIFICAYYTGCRRGELTNLKWEQVDLKAGVIRLNSGETKNDEARIIPITPEMRDVLKKKNFTPWVFTAENGKDRIGEFNAPWRKATEEAGVPGLLFHDLRRSAVRNMVRGGVSNVVARKISGHRTQAVFDRYNITDEQDIKAAAALVDSFVARGGKKFVSYMKFQQKCNACGAVWNAAFGIVGTTIIAQPPVECPECGSENIAKYGDGWIWDKPVNNDANNAT